MNRSATNNWLSGNEGFETNIYYFGGDDVRSGNGVAQQIIGCAYLKSGQQIIGLVVTVFEMLRAAVMRDKYLLNGRLRGD